MRFKRTMNVRSLGYYSKLLDNTCWFPLVSLYFCRCLRKLWKRGAHRTYLLEDPFALGIFSERLCVLEYEKHPDILGRLKNLEAEECVQTSWLAMCCRKVYWLLYACVLCLPCWVSILISHSVERCEALQMEHLELKAIPAPSRILYGSYQEPITRIREQDMTVELIDSH